MHVHIGHVHISVWSIIWMFSSVVHAQVCKAAWPCVHASMHVHVLVFRPCIVVLGPACQPLLLVSQTHLVLQLSTSIFLHVVALMHIACRQHSNVSCLIYANCQVWSQCTNLELHTGCATHLLGGTQLS